MKIKALGFLSIGSKGLGGSIKGGQLINAGVKILEIGGSYYVAREQRKAAEAMTNAGQTQVNNNYTIERQLTAEEIEEYKKNQELFRQKEIQRMGLELYDHAQNARLKEQLFDPPKEDHTNTYILGGLLFLGIMVMITKK
jgi:hypothetical protein